MASQPDTSRDQRQDVPISGVRHPDRHARGVDPFEKKNYDQRLSTIAAPISSTQIFISSTISRMQRSSISSAKL